MDTAQTGQASTALFPSRQSLTCAVRSWTVILASDPQQTMHEVAIVDASDSAARTDVVPAARIRLFRHVTRRIQWDRLVPDWRPRTWHRAQEESCAHHVARRRIPGSESTMAADPPTIVDVNTCARDRPSIRHNACQRPFGTELNSHEQGQIHRRDQERAGQDRAAGSRRAERRRP